MYSSFSTWTGRLCIQKLEVGRRKSPYEDPCSSRRGLWVKKVLKSGPGAHFGGRGSGVKYLVVHNSIVIFGKIKLRWYLNYTFINIFM